MGLIAKWKAQRAYKNAMQVYDAELTDWQNDVEISTKIIEAFELAAKGEDAVRNLTVQKEGEVVLWRGQGQFHQAARGAGQYVGSSQGFSVPIVAGIRYRVGATRGTYVSGDPVQKYAEVGDVVLTTQRLMFNGMFNTKEWLFSKWNGASTSSDETDYIFHVSNRQTTSGILFSKADGRLFNRFLAAALMAAEDGIESAITAIKKDAKEITGSKPALPPLAMKEPKALE